MAQLDGNEMGFSIRHIKTNFYYQKRVWVWQRDRVCVQMEACGGPIAQVWFPTG